MKRRSPEELEQEAQQLIRSMPTDLTQQLDNHRANQSFVLRMVDDFLTAQRMEQDRALIETATRMIQARGKFYDAVAKTNRARAEAVRGGHEFKTVERELDRKDEITELEHEARVAELKTKKLQEQNKQRDYLDPRGPTFSQLARLRDEALARHRTFTELAHDLDQQIADDLKRQPPGATAADMERRKKDLEEFRRTLLEDFAAALARQSRRGAGTTQEPGNSFGS